MLGGGGVIAWQPHLSLSLSLSAVNWGLVRLLDRVAAVCVCCLVKVSKKKKVGFVYTEL